MKLKETSQLYLASLDMKNAYGNVPHWKPREKLTDVGIEENLAALLQEIYSGCRAIYELNNHTSQKIQLKTGLEQGCPLSSALFTHTHTLSHKRVECGHT